ncbi:uncharacterized protein LOC126851551 isoform X2 [Cataglyphis hispanica]|uniref:uncharacterized protein LOC126851551 isoform X2 n=1 Tax=Cataglyphis hispanica TaxID=1086592 RepID=UPI00217F9F5E|nr:uncharacterized protein LOC126851551 isoform X2 [Cataglyphis hispanica]
MHNRVKIINKYYTNLEYDKNNTESEKVEKIFRLCNELNFEKTDKSSHRFFHAASLIEKHLNLFKSICEHVDIITSLLDYLYHFAASFMLDLKCSDENISPSMSIMFTINSMCIDNAVELFLQFAIIPKDQMEVYKSYKKHLLQHFEMILFEDSDLYAVIDCLKLKSITYNLHKIWVQESIAQTFKWHVKKCFGYLDIPIYIFQSKQELFTFHTFKCHIEIVSEMNILSIWSEDVTAAKNLAETLNQHIVFINTHMDFCPGVIIPYANVNLKSLDISFNLSQLNEHTCLNPIIPTDHKGLTYNLFYNGIWQIPIKYTYWVHNNILLANATCEDILKCIDSATTGFEIWNTMSSKSRMKILSNFASTLECNGKLPLASVISQWIKLSYIDGSLVQCYQNERFEVIKIRKPQGTIILKEKDEITLFRELTQSLIIGNSVIVICDPDLCTLAPYCDMFKISGVPPGVINLLSSQNTDFRYDIINNNTSSVDHNTYNCLTIMKHIIIPHK